MIQYDIKPSANHAYIHLQVEGNFTGKEMMKCVLESHALGLEMGIHSYLVDVRNARNIDTVVGNYEFANSDMKATPGVDPLARVAGLISPGDNSHDMAVTCCENAGIILKLFTDLSEADKYLDIK